MSELKTGLIVLSCIIASTFVFYRLTKATDTAAYNAPTQKYINDLKKNNNPILYPDNEGDDIEYESVRSTDESPNSRMSVGGTRRHRKRKSKSKRRRK